MSNPHDRPAPSRSHPNRREALRLIGAGIAAPSLLLQACASAPQRPSTGGSPLQALKPVRVEADRVIRTVVGLRPYRPSGFVVDAERLDGKLLVHNYGHGGGGITLSWGTSHLALELLEGSGARPGQRVAVLGCGVVGLSTARLLQRKGFDVTIYARDLPPNTTSNLAGASWYPSLVAEEDRLTPAIQAQLERAGRLSHEEFQSLVGDPRYGVRWREQYFLADEWTEQMAEGPWHYRLFRDLFPDEELFGPGQHPFPTRYAARDHTLFIEPPTYLRALLEDVRIAGGALEIRTFHDLAEVRALPEPIVFNCTGLGARELVGDTELTPVRGQLVFLLPQPEVDYAVNGVDGLGVHYMFPRRDGILLGGTAERGVESLDPDPATTERILQAHARVFSGMTGEAERIREG